MENLETLRNFQEYPLLKFGTFHGGLRNFIQKYPSPTRTETSHGELHVGDWCMDTNCCIPVDTVSLVYADPQSKRIENI